MYIKRNLVLMALLGGALGVSAQSSRQMFDFDWRFIQQDVQNAEAPSFNDNQWKRVNLPHDWDIYHAPKADAPTGNDGGYYPAGTGWYRNTFATPQHGEKDKVKLLFEGVYQNCTVYVNGQKAAAHVYGYTPFQVDVTPYLSPTGWNTVAVKVDNSLLPNCRWYSGSGIYRHVWLETYRDGAMDDPTQLFVRTEKLYGISSDGAKADSAVVRISYADRLDERRTYCNVKLWSPSAPNLYDIQVGNLTVKHGFRSLEYDAQQGFRLNGQPLLINGACVHHDNGVLGAMAFDQAEIRKVRLMKEAGFNLIRTSHNPTTRAFLDACDSLGMLAIDELYDGWYTEKTKGDYHQHIDSCYKEDFRALVTRDRNHPSVISWSLGNEVIERKELRVVQTARKFKAEVLRWDDTRPVTEALCAWDSDWEIYDPHAEVLDIVGYNYMIHKHKTDHERDPKRVMWQTESYPRQAFRSWAYVHDYPYILGDIVWTGLDYLGESGIGQFYHEGDPQGEHYNGRKFPFHGAYCGDVDFTGWRKPISHYRDMLYNVHDGSADFVYLAVREPNNFRRGRITENSWSVWPTWESWNWKGWEGKQIEAEIYTKAPRLNLYLNDKLVATREVGRQTEYKAVIPLNYEPGTLRAVALDAQGREVAESILRTAAEAYTIRLTPDKTVLQADGQDLAFVTVEVVDRQGNVMREKDVTLQVKVAGAGSFLAAGSSNLKDLEPMTSPKVTTYNGRAMIVVRAGRKAGKVTLTATADSKTFQRSVALRVR